eukprot:NODE_308_length_10101_cov_0.990102.p3 type:complete len:414 gc:universal NODE_308_length_10101_cov_0.990102:2342-1101(-)
MQLLPSYLQNSLIDPTTKFPTQWNPKDKCSLLEVQDGVVNYVGTGKSDTDAASIRSNLPIPLCSGIYYYELEIVSKGRDGYIGVGFCTETVSLNRLPGWENYSWGLHGDDGNIFACTGNGKPYGPTFTTGDVVGCGIHFIDNYAFYTKNGVHLGVAFKDLPLPNLGKENFPKNLYPCVGLRTPGEKVTANFGQRPFKFDIDSLMFEEKAKTWDKIMNSKLPGTPPSSYGDAFLKSVLNELILSYLIHHGYSGTASVFSQNVRRTQNLAFDNDTLTDIKNRHQIRLLVTSGDIDSVFDSTNRMFPGLFEKNEDITFKLKCRKFVEMVKIMLDLKVNGQASEFDSMLQNTLLYGQELQNIYRNIQKEDFQQKLVETFSLVAYDDPRKSSVSHLMDDSQRRVLADELNSAILSIYK